MPAVGAGPHAAPVAMKMTERAPPGLDTTIREALVEVVYEVSRFQRLPSVAGARILGVFPLDEERWSELNVARKRVHYMKPGTVGHPSCQDLGSMCCIPPWTALAALLAALMALPPQCCELACWTKHQDWDWPEHADHALIITDQGLVGHGPGPEVSLRRSAVVFAVRLTPYLPPPYLPPYPVRSHRHPLGEPQQPRRVGVPPEV